MGSKDITVTRYRGLKAFNNLFRESSKFSYGGAGGGVFEDLNLNIGEVLKFYPGSDKVLVKFKNGEVKRCFGAHSVVSDEINFSWTPVGYSQIDNEYGEHCIIPLSKFNAIVLDIKGDDFVESCVIGYISLDGQKILNNAFSGELKIQYYDSSISLKQTGISIEGENILINGEPFSRAVYNGLNQHFYNYEELLEIMEDLSNRVSYLESK